MTDKKQYVICLPNSTFIELLKAKRENQLINAKMYVSIHTRMNSCFLSRMLLYTFMGLQFQYFATSELNIAYLYSICLLYTITIEGII